MSFEEQMIVEEQLRKRIATLEDIVRRLVNEVQHIHKQQVMFLADIYSLERRVTGLQKGDHEQQDSAVQ